MSVVASRTMVEPVVCLVFRLEYRKGVNVKMNQRGLVALEAEPARGSVQGLPFGCPSRPTPFEEGATKHGNLYTLVAWWLDFRTYCE